MLPIGFEVIPVELALHQNGIFVMNILWAEDNLPLI